MFRALQAWTPRRCARLSAAGSPSLAALACPPAGRLLGNAAIWGRARRPARRRRQPTHYRHRQGQGRPHPAAVGERQCGGCRAVHAQRRRDGARRIQQSGPPAAGEGRRRQRARRPAGGAAGARRGRRDHPGAAVRAHGRSGRAGGARPQRAGDRVLDRRQRGGPRRLSPELPAGVGRRAHHRLRGRPGHAVRSPRWCRTTPMAPWPRAHSSRRWRAATAASSRSSAIRSTRRRCRRRPTPSRRRRWERAVPMRSSFRTAPTPCPRVVQTLIASGIDPKRVQLLGTGLWEDPQIFSSAPLDGAWYAGPTRPAFATSPPATAAATARIRCAPPRSPTTRSRWSRRW